MLIDELRDLLRELAEATGAVSAAVVHERPPGERIGKDRHIAMLGKGAFLCIEFQLAQGGEPIAGGREPGGGEQAPHSPAGDRALAIEQCSRALRACARRWGQERVPPVALGGRAPPSYDRVSERVSAFLQALANVQHGVNAVVARRGRVIASAGALTDEQRAGIPFTHRRLNVEASRKHDSSHAELTGEDYYAVSFWYDACLIIYFSAPYAVDFVRHRARQVARELSHLLPLLDEPPPSGANVAPIPE